MSAKISLKNYKKTAFLALSICLFSACSHNAQPAGKPLPQMTYAHLNAYSIHGGAVRIQQSFVADEQTKKLASEFPIAPDRLIQKYANKRFVTSGTTGMLEKLVFDIQNASLKKVEDEANLVGFLSGSAEDVYQLTVLIAMTPVRADGQRAAPFTVHLQRQIGISQNASLAEREFRQFEMLENAITEIDNAVTNLVQNQMTAEYF